MSERVTFERAGVEFNRRVAEIQMTTDELIEFHNDRAVAELDCALSASCIQAAQAHFGLSALHLDKMQDLKEVRTEQGHSS